ncbi:MAG: hypothetical protein JWQ19_1702 [Subtercola sp.]|nr:hypothetical protein [Subtercola sp.]
MQWNIKAAFRAYVSAIPDGTEQWLSSAGSTTADAFHFDLTDASGFDFDTNTGRLVFAGAVRFRGYRGALLVSIADPVLDVGPAGISISVNTASPGTESDYLLFATAEASITVQPHGVSWHAASPRLTAEGGMLLGSVYPEGTELDPFICTLTEENHFEENHA